MVSMGTVWDRTAEFLSDNLSAITPIAFFAILLPYVVLTVAMPLAAAGTGSGQSALYGLLLLCGIVMLWGNLTIVALALDPFAGGPAARGAATRRLLPVLAWSLLLAVVMVVLLTLVFAAILPLSGMDIQAAASGGEMVMPTGGGAWLLALGLLAVTVLLVWLSARLVLFSPIMIAERRRAGVFARSFSLTRGITLKIVGVTVLYVIVSWVASTATQFVFGSVLRLIGGGEGPLTVTAIATAILVGLVTMAFIILAAAFTGKLYLAVRDARQAIIDSL